MELPTCHHRADLLFRMLVQRRNSMRLKIHVAVSG
jgi:hypothetical protein